MDYSKTVNLPATDFPMRANLPKREPEMLEKWERDDIYHVIQESRKEAPLFVLHDGPPYANGHIHTGHALNKILKDIIVKHKTMQGFRAPYVPGWDCHGLPIELNVTRVMGEKARTAPKVEIRKKCREYAGEFVDIQREEFKRLGVFAEYEKPYLTMSPHYEAVIVESFGKILEKGNIYKGKKPIYWCPSCVTALAEAEVEYHDHTSPSIYVKFPIASGSLPEGVDSSKAFVVIWTTTPWTLPANLAVSFHPSFPYAFYRAGDEWLLVAQGMKEHFENTTGLELVDERDVDPQILSTLDVRHPFIDRESKVLFGDHVTLEQGTGIVHTAPGHGQEDYVIGLANGLDIYCPVDDEGRYTDEFPEMQGVHVSDANEKVNALLKEKGLLIHEEKISHSYPHCWRCKKPLIFRATAQWFLSMDDGGLRQKGLEAVDSTKWVPAWGETRFRSMVEGRPDWCLSRQRSWGVPIPSFRCAECGENNMTAESVAHFAKIAREKGIDAWYTDDIGDLIPAGTTCSCGSSEFIKEEDILDVWFDSGVSHLAVLDYREDHRWPADIYLEGSDQHRGWFQSSLWPALALKGEPPYGTVLTHGFLLDAEGKAMSKSQGNVIPPEKIIKQYGADILRLWVSSEDYRNDLRIGMDILKQIADSYRRIRNSLKFILGNLADFNESDAVPYEDISDIDKWVLHRLSVLRDEVIGHYEKYEFHLVYRKILNFCAVDLSSLYFDVSKDILYVELKDSKKRRSNQTALNHVLHTLMSLIAPVLPFTAEEVWQFMGREGSVHTQTYHELPEQFRNEELFSRMEKVVNVKKDLLKVLEELRKEKLISSSLEAEVIIAPRDNATGEIMTSMGSDLTRLFQVASVEVVATPNDTMQEQDSSYINAEKSSGVKCVRCWNYTYDVGEDLGHPELCARCAAVINQMED